MKDYITAEMIAFKNGYKQSCEAKAGTGEDASVVMDRLESEIQSAGNSEKSNPKEEALNRLRKMVGGFPDDFDADREIQNARDEKYGDPLE